MPLQRYAGAGHDAGVLAYGSGRGFIVIQFGDRRTYLYTHAQPGRAHVEAMKKLAESGSGLTTYINRHVRANYARRLD